MEHFPNKQSFVERVKNILQFRKSYKSLKRWILNEKSNSLAIENKTQNLSSPLTDSCSHANSLPKQ